MRRDSERILIRYHEDVVPRIQPIGLEEKLFIRDPSLVVPIIGYVDVRSGYELELDTDDRVDRRPDHRHEDRQADASRS